MLIPRNKSILPDRNPSASEQPQPVSTWQTIINWIVETDRRFRMTQDRIDRMSDRF